MNTVLRFVRNVTRHGNPPSAYINLPKEWVVQHGLEIKDKLTIDVLADGCLLVHPRLEGVVEEGDQPFSVVQEG